MELLVDHATAQDRFSRVSIDVTRREAVALVTVNRADAMNALDVATLSELRDRLAELRDAYAHLLSKGVEIQRAVDHVCQRSLYFTDPDGNGLEIYYEMRDALSLFPNGRGDEDERLPLSRPAEPLPGWLLEDWPSPAAFARVERLRRQAPNRSGNTADSCK